jgi:hypothetical protein
MLRSTAHLKGFVVRATDGELGTVDRLYFDDETWAMITHRDWPAKRLDVALTKEQVEKSPDINTHLPVSRQHEAAFLGYYGYPYYWGGPRLYLHYGRPPYWLRQAEHKSALSLSGAKAAALLPVQHNVHSSDSR